MPSVKFLVSGKVQGVFFRASTRTEALRLKLSGYARNLSDGRVEVLARGETAALSELEDWLQQGPPLARVDEVHRVEVEDSDVDATLDESETSLFPNFAVDSEWRKPPT